MANITKSGRKKIKLKDKRILVIAIAVAAVLILIFVVGSLRTFDSYRVIRSIELPNEAGETLYIPLGVGYAKYSNDGISYIYDGEISWTQTFEMKNPAYDYNEYYFAVCELNSSEIYLYNSEGLVSKLTSSYPVLDVEVSDQGVVALLMGDGNSNYIELKDKDDNLLAQGKTSFSASGYPLDISISSDGTILAASYLCVSSGVTTSKVVFYDYTKSGDLQTDRIKAGFDFENTVIPTIHFEGNSTLYAVGDNLSVIFDVGGSIKKVDEKPIDSKIISVFFGKGYEGIVTESETSATEKIVNIYSKNGKEEGKFSCDFKYRDIRFVSNGVLMYGMDKCRIYTFSGKLKFDYTFDTNIANITEIGRNKYILATTDKLEIIKLR